MKNFGVFLLVMGIGSAILHFFDYEFRLLMWVDTWGPTVGWVIRGGLAVAGAALLVASVKRAKPAG